MDDNELSNQLWTSEIFEKISDKSVLQQTILEQYKLCVEMADRISSRRDKANGFFLGINGLLLTAGAPLLSKYQFDPAWLLVFPLLVLLMVLYFWRALITSYRQLNGAKFQIIGEFEKRLPASPYGRAEWEYLLARGKDGKKYRPLTHLESKIPIVFAIAYVLLFTYFICR